MDSQRTPASLLRLGCATPIGLAALGLVVVFGAGAGWLMHSFSAGPPPVTQTIRPTPNVVTAVRDLSRLETTSYHVERVVDLSEKQQQLFGLVEAEDALLLVAAGDVIAGIDFGKLEEGDVDADWDKRKVEITLPPPEILTSRLDNEHTYVHSRSTDLLADRNEKLESQARKEAERLIVEAAMEAGVLSRARKNAERTVESLVRSLGYEDVEIRFADE
jgi:hypothetical protein